MLKVELELVLGITLGSHDTWSQWHEARSTVALAETCKYRALMRFGDGPGYEFVPLALESFGCLEKKAAHFLNDLGGVSAADGCAFKADVLRTFRQELSCALC